MDVIAKQLRKEDQHTHDAFARPSKEEAEAAIQTLLAWIGEDIEREGLLDTPQRVVRAYRELFQGYEGDALDILSTTFEDVGGYHNIVFLRDISFISHCEHHMLPFKGKAHIAYYPNGGVVGLSKLARVVEIYSRRLQTQERLTAQIMDAINKGLAPRGSAVMIEAEHSCMALRGIQKEGVTTVTSLFSGVFKDDIHEQQQFLRLVQGR